MRLPPADCLLLNVGCLFLNAIMDLPIAISAVNPIIHFKDGMLVDPDHIRYMHSN